MTTVATTSPSCDPPRQGEDAVLGDAHAETPPESQNDSSAAPTEFTLQDWVQEIVSLCDKQNVDDEAEEGAIDEEEVPFERTQETISHSYTVMLLNLPPELDQDHLVSTLRKLRAVRYAHYTKPTQCKVVFGSFHYAKQSRQLLDGLKLYNRTIQAILAPDERSTNQRSHSQRYLPSSASTSHYPSYSHGPIPSSSSSHMGQGNSYTIRNFNGYRRSSHPSRGLHGHSSSSRYNSYTTTVSGGRLPPPPMPYGSRRNFTLDTSRGNAAAARAPPSRQTFGRFLSSMNGTSVRDLFEAGKPLSQWQEEQSMEEQQRNFDLLHTETGVTNRYLLVGGLPPDVVGSLESATEWVQGHTRKNVQVEIVTMPTYLDAQENPNNVYLHLTFPTRSDCQRAMTRIKASNTAVASSSIMCKYAPPRKAYNTLWLGNITELCGYCKDLDELKELMELFGQVVDVTPRVDRGCMLVTYSTVQEAIVARNRLAGISLSGKRYGAINVDFAIADERTRSDGEQMDYAEDVANGDYREAKSGGDDPGDVAASTREKSLGGVTNPYSDYDSQVNQPSANLSNEGQNSRGYKRANSDDTLIEQGPSKRKHEDAPKPQVLSELLKRGKHLCNISAILVRGDAQVAIPSKLDVNQRANPDRLVTSLSKQPELSLWQLGADTKEDCSKYNGLCDYLISKNRLALIQDESYEIYICPPCQEFVATLKIPDAKYMYAYIMPRNSG